MKADVRLIRTTFFRNKSATTLTARDMSLEELRDLILKTSAAAKPDLPWLKLATFGDKRSDKGSLRHDANVISISGIEADYDDEVMSFDEATEILEAARLSTLLYTSPSHSKDKPRLRVLCPTSRDLPPGERAKLVARLNGIFGGVFAPESFTLSQSYYFGSVKRNAAHRAVIVAGDCIDLRDDLDASAIGNALDNEHRPNKKFVADDLEELAAAVAVIPNDIRDYYGWKNFGMAIYSATEGEGFEIFDDFSRRWIGGKYNEEHTQKAWRQIERSPPKLIGAGTIYHMANKASPEWRWRYEAEQMAKSLNMRREEEPPDTAPAYSEEALALLFAQRHAARRRYVSAWNKWFSFDGKQWTVDETRETWSLARKLCREASRGVNKLREAKSIANAKTRAAVVSLAGEDRRLAATVDQWDADPWLLNTPGGVIDLRTGERRDHRTQDYMTKITAVAPDASCPIPLWRAFLTTVTRNDKGLQAYLARVTGYALTGVTTEHALFFLHGGGANGKGVFMNTTANVLGDYHRTAPIEVFTATNNEQHPTQLAMLRGARLVTATETEEGRRWAESRIKTLTGGDRIPARFMRQDFFEYTPQFKLMISGNHKPGLRSVDEAIRRRLNLVPFDVTIPEAERDKELTGKLKAEGPGVLAWMIAGCLEWQRVGLAPPKIVTEATDAYLEDEDTIKLWVDEVCLQGEQYWTPTNQLFASWQDWAEARGEYVIPF
jgi:putative DNA primase/helicase